MSFEPDNKEQEIDVKDLLQIIADNLILMNARIECAFETGIELEDIKDGN